MADSVKKVLFVNSEMVPYLPESPVGTISELTKRTFFTESAMTYTFSIQS